MSPLKDHVPVTVSFELDYAEFLDDAILDAFELHESFARNAQQEPREQEWWILKPSMSDRGQGIRLFRSENELRGIFEEWEAENPDPDSDEEEGGSDIDGAAHPPQRPSQPSFPPPDTPLRPEGTRTGVTTSQLRHFVAQPYIAPLLFPSLGNRKFHIRSYVLAVGALRVYVCKEMLALFAAERYVPPGEERDRRNSDAEGLDMRRHLTNTCLQSGERHGSVVRFWDLPPTPPESGPGTLASAAAGPFLPAVFTHICTATSHLFRAACAQPTSFQPIPNAFEVFGVDWMVDEGGEVWLLEVNAFPDFRQSGEEGRGVVEGVWRGVVGVVGRFWGGRGEEGKRGEEGEEREEVEREDVKEVEGMVRVLEVDMGRG